MPDKQRTLGQFETPPDVADLLLGLCLRHPAGRVLDPSCGTGAFLARVARWQQGMGSLAGNPAGDLWGVELDATAAQQAAGQLPQAIILNHNFFALQPGQVAGAPFDAILGNPPYTRAGWLDRMEAQLGQQLPLFDPASPDERVTAARPGKRAQAILPGRMWGRVLNRRAGLHAYFFVHSAAFLREGGRLGFVVPNGWLDVAYGEALKQFLLDDFKIVALIESQVERWFPAAKVNTCLVVLKRCQDPAGRDWSVFVHLNDPVLGVPIAQRDMYHAQGLRPTSLLTPGESLTTYYRLFVPRTAAAPAQLELAVGLYDFGSEERLPTTAGQEAATLAVLPLQPIPGEFPNATAVNFGAEVLLVGYEVAPRTTRPGEALTLTLYWQPLRPLDSDYTFFAQLLDEDTTRWASADVAPPNGTSRYPAGEVQTLDLPLLVDENTPAGVYPIVIGLYTRTPDGGFQRLQIVVDGRITMEDMLTLTKIRVAR